MTWKKGKCNVVMKNARCAFEKTKKRNIKGIRKLRWKGKRDHAGFGINYELIPKESRD